LGNTKFVTIRNQYTIIEALSKTGGFASLVSLLCGTIARYFAKLQYKASLITDVYRTLSLKKQKRKPRIEHES
jgi:hypothetical protein